MNSDDFGAQADTVSQALPLQDGQHPLDRGGQLRVVLVQTLQHLLHLLHPINFGIRHNPGYLATAIA